MPTGKNRRHRDIHETFPTASQRIKALMIEQPGTYSFVTDYAINIYDPHDAATTLATYARSRELNGNRQRAARRLLRAFTDELIAMDD